MRGKVTLFALLGLVGLVIGVAVTGPAGARYQRTAEVVLRPNSDPSHVVAMTAGEHPGVRVFAHGGRFITITATGGAERAFNGVSAAIIEISQQADGKVMSVMSHLETPQWRPPGNRVNYGLVGLLAGLSAALGFVVPPRSRVTARPV
jgi:hypothetical protein